MNNRKKIIAVALSLVMVAGAFAGCSGAKDDNSSAKEKIVLDDSRIAQPVPAADSFASGSGTEQDPYVVTTKEELAFMATNEDISDSFFVLGNDIEINDTATVDSWSENAPQYQWDAADLFSNSLDGNGHSISGVYMYEGNEKENIGFLRATSSDSVIKNVTLKDSYIECAGDGFVGGLVADSYGDIIDCEAVNVDIKARSCSASIFASTLTEGVISGCNTDEHCSIIVEQGAVNAGMICALTNGEVSDCNAMGNLAVGEGSFVGGAIGHATNCSVSNVDSYVHIDAEKCETVGGVIGNASAVDSLSGGCAVENCENNSADIIANGLGGIIGAASTDSMDLVISNCKNNCDLSAASKLGGIVANINASNTAYNVVIKACENEGELSSQEGTVGGIVASAFGSALTIDACENEGSVESKDGSVGGIIGAVVVAPSTKKQAYNFAIKNCTNDGKVTTNAISAGGIAGNIGGVAGSVGSEKDRDGVADSNSWDKYVISGCVNNGAVIVDMFGSYAGGIIGIWDDKKADCQIISCKNNGDIRSANLTSTTDSQPSGAIGGIGGMVNSAIAINGCESTGKATAEDSAVKTGDSIASHDGVLA